MEEINNKIQITLILKLYHIFFLFFTTILYVLPWQVIRLVQIITGGCVFLQFCSLIKIMITKNRLKIFQEHTLEYKIEKQQEQFLLRLKAFPQRVNFILNSDSFTK